MCLDTISVVSGNQLMLLGDHLIVVQSNPRHHVDPLCAIDRGQQPFDVGLYILFNLQLVFQPAVVQAAGVLVLLGNLHAGVGVDKNDVFHIYLGLRGECHQVADTGGLLQAHLISVLQGEGNSR